MQAFETNTFTSRAITTTLIVASIGTLLLICWYAVDVLMLIFASVLLAVSLRGLSDIVQRHTDLKQTWSLLIVLLAISALIGVAVWLLAERVVVQTDYLLKQLPLASATLATKLEEYDWGNRILTEMPSTWEIFRGQDSVLGRITGIFSGVLGAVLNFTIIIVLGCYLAAQSDLYVRGFVHLLPKNYRNGARSIATHLSMTLRRWLVGRFILMVVNGGLTAIGLWFLDIPLALTLGLFTGVLNFIPNFGPLIAAVPAILFALTIGPRSALYVGLLYLGVQSLDGYVFTPLVNRRSVELPPALTISAQVLLGVLVGGIGILLAGPITAVVVTCVRKLSDREMFTDGN